MILRLSAKALLPVRGGFASRGRRFSSLSPMARLSVVGAFFFPWRAKGIEVVVCVYETGAWGGVAVGVFPDDDVGGLSTCAVRRRPVTSVSLVRHTTATLAGTVVGE